jgi:hypothetical protein
MPPTVGSRSHHCHRSSIGAVVNRGPNLASCSAAIAAAIIADATAREKREEAHRRRCEEAFRAVQRHPLSVAR